MADSPSFIKAAFMLPANLVGLLTAGASSLMTGEPLPAGGFQAFWHGDSQLGSVASRAPRLLQWTGAPWPGAAACRARRAAL